MRKPLAHRVYTIRNQRLEIDVVPSFLGSVSAIRDAGGECNHLATAFPKPGAFGWSYPWYGGLQPEVSLDRLSWTASLEGEGFTVETVSCADALGTEWAGLRQRAPLSKEASRGLTLELDTLTLGNSPVVKLVWRLVQRGRCPPESERRLESVFAARRRTGRHRLVLGGLRTKTESLGFRPPCRIMGRRRQPAHREDFSYWCRLGMKSVWRVGAQMGDT